MTCTQDSSPFLSINAVFFACILPLLSISTKFLPKNQKQKNYIYVGVPSTVMFRTVQSSPVQSSAAVQQYIRVQHSAALQQCSIGAVLFCVVHCTVQCSAEAHYNTQYHSAQYTHHTVVCIFSRSIESCQLQLRKQSIDVIALAKTRHIGPCITNPC